MITGFNTDVEYEGRIYHVQTEDKGRNNPVVESLVYSGGEIIASLRTPYGELLHSSSLSEQDVQQRMEDQHQALIREIRNGKFDPEGPKPFGHKIISNRSLDEVVMDFLSQEVGVERIRLEMEPNGPVLEGARSLLRFRVVAEASDRPVGGAKVSIRLVSTVGRSRELFSGATGPDGTVEVPLDIPRVPGGNAALVCQAEAAGDGAELRQLIDKA